ncbi:unnamed protein product [Adineta steineri]|uniref:G-protein coupled receptors family 1 profile domain-containing protein n=1 Tax=Adineta steineri TaxID=433720 RepID=A0A815PMR1_9BILA|nr:unnamed protein product [Adineta steineri]
MILIIRVILQKHRIGQRAIWQRNRKMVIQLASLSTMYIAVWIPDIISYVIPIIVPNPLALDLASNVFCYFEYLAALLCPFVCLVGLPEVRQSIHQIFIRFNTIQPASQHPPGIGLFDWFCDVFGPVIVGTVATMILIIRIIVQKHRVGQRAIWQRNRKMVIQLASLSTMYIAVWIPDIISFVLPIIVPNPLALDLASNVFCYFEYFAALLCPFACLVGLPEVRQSMRQIFIRFNTIQPSSQNPVEFLRPLPQRVFGK